jgi:hypothetical protein
MSIRLDWKVESERVQNQGEDPNTRRRRRLARARFFLVVGFLGALLFGGGALVVLRLSAVDDQIKQNLADTVLVETTALRIGDYLGYMELQRSASPNWLQIQGQRFTYYQNLKAANNVVLDGEVLDLAIDGPRGRVLLAETINGIAHQTVWFYWRYNDGWRHVPPDYTFWGLPAQKVSGQVTIQYNALDSGLATALAENVDRWWRTACEALACGETPPLLIEIVAEPSTQVAWRGDTLVVPSPLAAEERVVIAPALSNALADEVARQMASATVSKLTGGYQAPTASDAAWLQQGITYWLAAQLTGRGDPNSLAFVQGIRTVYGVEGLRRILQALTVEPDVRALASALGDRVEALNLDWRVFFQWRLDVEKTLLSQGDQNAVINLWDAQNPNATTYLAARLANPIAPTPQVQSVTIVPGPDAVPQALVSAVLEGLPITITFRLVDGSWRRAS